MLKVWRKAGERGRPVLLEAYGVPLGRYGPVAQRLDVGGVCLDERPYNLGGDIVLAGRVLEVMDRARGRIAVGSGTRGGSTAGA